MKIRSVKIVIALTILYSFMTGAAIGWALTILKYTTGTMEYVAVIVIFLAALILFIIASMRTLIWLHWYCYESDKSPEIRWFIPAGAGMLTGMVIFILTMS